MDTVTPYVTRLAPFGSSRGPAARLVRERADPQVAAAMREGVGARGEGGGRYVEPAKSPRADVVIASGAVMLVALLTALPSEEALAAQ